MDSVFGIGFPELVVILILAGVIMGPRRIRQVARTLGQLVAQMQRISNEFKRQLNAELDALDDDEVRGALDEMKQLRREVDSLRRQVTSIPDESRRALRDGERVFKPRSAVPAEAAGEPSDDEGQEPPTVGPAIEAPPSAPVPSKLPNPIEVADDPE